MDAYSPESRRKRVVFRRKQRRSKELDLAAESAYHAYQVLVNDARQLRDRGARDEELGVVMDKAQCMMERVNLDQSLACIRCEEAYLRPKTACENCGWPYFL